MRILFLAPYPFDEAPSQRFRFEQYFKLLEKEGISYELKPFLDSYTWSILYKNGHTITKAKGILHGFIRRLKLLFRVTKYNYIFIHREATPIGPPFVEWILARVLRKKIIYDFDDAIWIPNTSGSNRIVKGIKNHEKVAKICKWSFKVSVGNQYIGNFACKFNKNVVLNPTTIDTESLHNPELLDFKKNYSNPFIIGWTGTHSTLKYIQQILPVLDQLNKEVEFKFRVISNQSPKLDRDYVEFIPWSKKTEINDLGQFHIGIMPLEDDPWSKGKCGFKALQYMALGIPALVSPVGVNSEIVDHGVNGFICKTEEEWHDSIKILIANKDAIQRFGQSAREKVIAKYSVLSNQQNFLNLFKKN